MQLLLTMARLRRHGQKYRLRCASNLNNWTDLFFSFFLIFMHLFFVFLKSIPKHVVIDHIELYGLKTTEVVCTTKFKKNKNQTTGYFMSARHGIQYDLENWAKDTDYLSARPQSPISNLIISIFDSRQYRNRTCLKIWFAISSHSDSL